MDALPLLEDLFKRYGSKGHASWIQQQCEATAKSCAVPEKILELSELGNIDVRTGARKNVERDLVLWSRNQPWRAVLPEAYEFKVWCRRRNREGVTCMPIKTILPHELLGAIYNFNVAVFMHLFIPSDAELIEFWRHDGQRELCAMHANNMDGAPLEKCIPIAVWGDDATFNKRDKWLALHWCSPLKTGLTRFDSRWLFGALHYKRIIKTLTADCMYEAFVWSLQCAANGFYPSHDHTGRAFSATYHPERYQKSGEPIAGDYRFLFSETRGDMPWQIQTFHWVGFSHAVQCCHLCRASKSIHRLSYTDTRRQARHRQTLYTHAQYMMWTREDTRSPLCRVPGWHLWRCWADAQHCLDLGILQHSNGSCLFVLASTTRFWSQRTRQQRLEAAHRHYVEWCAANNIADVGEMFTEATLRPKATAYPMNKGFKAAEQRWMVHWLHAVLFSIAAPTHEDQLMKLTYASLAQFDLVCRRNGRIVPPAELHVLQGAGDAFLASYNALALLALRRGQRLWKLVPKHHMFMHMIWDMSPVANPRTVHNYLDEAMIGHLKHIGAACHPSAISHRVVDRYMLWTCVRLYQLRV